LTPENAARELGFSEEAEPGVMKRQKQRRKTDKSSSYNDGAKGYFLCIAGEK